MWRNSGSSLEQSPGTKYAILVMLVNQWSGKDYRVRRHAGSETARGQVNIRSRQRDFQESHWIELLISSVLKACSREEIGTRQLVHCTRSCHYVPVGKLLAFVVDWPGHISFYLSSGHSLMWTTDIHVHVETQYRCTADCTKLAYSRTKPILELPVIQTYFICCYFVKLWTYSEVPQTQNML